MNTRTHAVAQHHTHLRNRGHRDAEDEIVAQLGYLTCGHATATSRRASQSGSSRGWHGFALAIAYYYYYYYYCYYYYCYY